MSMKLEIVVPIRVWEKLNEMEQRTGVRKEDILTFNSLFEIRQYTGGGCGS
jgi:hypothetical protein